MAVKKATTKPIVNDNENILAEGQDVMICGAPYTFRRMDTRDVFAFAKILSKAIATVGNVQVENPDSMGLIILTGLAENDREVGKFYGSLVGLSGEEFMSQPPEFFGEFIDLLPQHYDMANFLQTVMKAVKSLGSLWQKQ
jgi:hypothetical protein